MTEWWECGWDGYGFGYGVGWMMGESVGVWECGMKDRKKRKANKASTNIRKMALTQSEEAWFE